MLNVKDFLKRKDIVITPQRYLIEALGAMAQGLFASLLIGTIIKTLGQQTGLETLVDLGGYATAMSGPAMAVAIGWALHCPPLVLFSLVTVGYSSNALGGAGGPLAVLIIAIVAAELGKAVSKETRVDILVTPLVTIFAGVGLSMLIAAPIGAAASQVGTLIMWATEQAPFLMGILVSVIVGVALTLPISSAAICAALGLTGLAGGAAVAGCCAQMIGFAVMSYKENGVGGLISQGLGTSMLQMGNIVKNPRIWIAPTLASAITGPLATCVFHMEMNGAAVSSGMGTCGLVGQLGVKAIRYLRRPVLDALQASRRFEPPMEIADVAELAKPFLSIGNQYGEGWFLTGEMVELIRSGVPNIVCIQPFACLPNHVVGKGVIKSLRRAYPEANIVAVDYDPGASEVNQLNRIKLMISVAKENYRNNRGEGFKLEGDPEGGDDFGLPLTPEQREHLADIKARAAVD